MERQYLQHLLDKVHHFSHNTEQRIIETAKQRHHKKHKIALHDVIQNWYSVIVGIFTPFR
jgi:uncharacterized membrane protein